MVDLKKLTKLYQLKKYSKVVKLGSNMCSKGKSYPAKLPILIASSYAKQNQHAKAIPYFEMALAKEPNSYSGNLNSGISFYELNRYEEAASFFANALQISPKSISTLTWCALTANKLGRPDLAIQYCAQALQIDSKCKEAFNILGLAYLESRDFKKALEALAAAIHIDNKYPAAFKNFAVVLDRIGKPKDALYYADIALKLLPNSVEIIYLKATILRSLNKHKEAIKLFENLLVLTPDNCDIHNQIGLTLEELGEFEKAIACYKHALSIDNANTNALANLSQLVSFSADDSKLDLMEKIVKAESTKSKTRSTLSYALGQQHDKAKNYESAFNYFSLANKIRFSEFEKFIDYEFSLLQRIKSYFTAQSSLSEFQIERPSTNQKTPIFILGMPRSGTSLVEQIVSSHSLVGGGGELPYLRHSLDIESTLNSSLSNESLTKIRESYFSQLDSLEIEQKFITDKMPANFRYIGFILLAFPEAKVCHTVRDPMATCWSIYRTNFASEGNVYRYDLESLGDYFNAYRALMTFWHDLFPGRIYDLNYEELTENQEESSRKLLNFIGLNWEEGCLNYSSSNRVVRTASLQQVRKGIYQGSSKAWENYRPYLKLLIDKVGEN